MKNAKNWAWLLLFGSLWGMSEVIGGEVLYNNNIPHASVWLTAWALFILGLGRGIINKAGTSTVIGCVAAVFKLVNASPYFCHILGIFFLGLAFDLASTLLMKNERKISYRSLLTGVLSVYSGYALFALTITYIVRFEPWVGGGINKVLDHIFIVGSLAALASLVLVPLGYKTGITGEVMIKRRSSWPWAVTGVVLLWVLVRIIG
ncbi:MAG: hypothetical protein WCC06_01875 [Candidatus Aminicenantales bacterium]